MHDLAVIGLGALGVHVAAEAASRGLDTVGVERHGPAHEHGATGGRTRIFRVVYTFGSDYVPALLRSRDAWDRLDERHPGAVRHRTGALLVGRPDDPEIAAALGSAAAHSLPHEILGTRELAARFPQHRPLEDDLTLFDPQGALLLPQSITAVVSADAVASGAELRYGAEAVAIEPIGGGHEVVTADGGRLRARRIVVAAGAWTSRFAPEYADAVELRRVVLQWYATPDAGRYGPAHFPVGVRRSGSGIRYSFFPQADEHGIKINFHVPKAVVTSADAQVMPVPADYADAFDPMVRATLPEVGALTRSAAYVESYTPDFRILFDRIAGLDDAWLLAGGSGQAFKLAPVLAEHAISRVLDEEPALALDGVLRRLTTPSTAVAGP